MCTGFPFPCNLLFLIFLFACELFWRTLPIVTSCWIDLPSCTASWWSWAAVQLAFVNWVIWPVIWTVNVNHLLVDCTQWTHIRLCFISIRYMIGPICRGLHIIRVILAYKLSLAVYFSSLCMALTHWPIELNIIYHGFNYTWLLLHYRSSWAV